MSELQAAGRSEAKKRGYQIRLEAKNLVRRLLQYFLARLKGRYARDEQEILASEWATVVYCSLQNGWQPFFSRLRPVIFSCWKKGHVFPGVAPVRW